MENNEETFVLNIQEFHPDNGRFSRNTIKNYLYKNNQTITFFGVNHH